MRKRAIHYARRVWTEKPHLGVTFVSTLCGIQFEVLDGDGKPLSWLDRATKKDSRVTCKTCKGTPR